METDNALRPSRRYSRWISLLEVFQTNFSAVLPESLPGVHSAAGFSSLKPQPAADSHSTRPCSRPPKNFARISSGVVACRACK
ncbi:hypothetical protein HYPSUDRAFT_48255 [Hypholoma sublateritium FD-334 SS-4]|uniref:Uncharacterized protein n=1 Tax=Hypholoma sublateritium (strain FD-334 SS-4) TaxID=945553 RepID=A0A0D2KLQ5_HYPSF|nr:hypothetical protein HYPSUDRAFT_48255 [Hypholoma sublateritium FD-334 SS-4]